jgi:hypothetical protein
MGDLLNVNVSHFKADNKHTLYELDLKWDLFIGYSRHFKILLFIATQEINKHTDQLISVNALGLAHSSYNVCLFSISSYPKKLHIRVQDSEIKMYIVDERKTNLRLPSGYSEVVNRTTTDEQLPKEKGHNMNYITPQLPFSSLILLRLTLHKYEFPFR